MSDSTKKLDFLEMKYNQNIMAVILNFLFLEMSVYYQKNHKHRKYEKTIKKKSKFSNVTAFSTI